MSNETLVSTSYMPWEKIWKDLLSAYTLPSDAMVTHHVTLVFDESALSTYDHQFIINEMKEKYAMIGIEIVIDNVYSIIDSLVPYSNDIYEFFETFRRKSSVYTELLAYPTYVGTLIYLCNRPDFERAAGTHFRYGGGFNATICNLGTRTPFQPFNGYRIVLIAHELGHAHGASHDNTVYNGDIRTIMHSPLFTDTDGRIFFSAKSAGEIYSYMAAHDAYFNHFDNLLSVNGSIAWQTAVGVSENYVFTYEGEGELVDILVVYHPYKQIEKISLLDYLNTCRADYDVTTDGVVLRNWYQRANPGLYGYVGVVKMSDGSTQQTNPVYVYLSGKWS